MELQENNAEILARQLVRTYTDELEAKQLEGHDSNAVERAPIIEKGPQARSSKLDFWLKKLSLEKNSS